MAGWLLLTFLMCFHNQLSSVIHFQYLNVFNTLTLKQIFKKLEHRFLVESTKIENALLPYKTAMSEANVKINKMVFAKWAFQKERSFAGNYFIF